MENIRWKQRLNNYSKVLRQLTKLIEKWLPATKGRSVNAFVE